MNVLDGLDVEERELPKLNATSEGLSEKKKEIFLQQQRLQRTSCSTRLVSRSIFPPNTMNLDISITASENI